jgi:hypothetical protein
VSDPTLRDRAAGVVRLAQPGHQGVRHRGDRGRVAERTYD